MATEAQINANRQNAQKSTGPATAEGKAAVSQNALKHGLFAVQEVITTESQDDFDLLRDQMLAQLAPVGAVESMLAFRAISLTWRLKRAETIQNEVIEEMIETHLRHRRADLAGHMPKEACETPEYMAIGRVARQDWEGEGLIERLFEYERRIEKSLYRTMTELRAKQGMRWMAEDVRADAGGNSAKQSQSGRRESSYTAASLRSATHPQKLIASAIKTCSKRLKQWGGGGGASHRACKDYEASPAGRKPLSQGRGQETGLAAEALR